MWVCSCKDNFFAFFALKFFFVSNKKWKQQSHLIGHPPFWYDDILCNDCLFNTNANILTTNCNWIQLETAAFYRAVMVEQW
jgi:hypothetical protein